MNERKQPIGPVRKLLRQSIPLFSLLILFGFAGAQQSIQLNDNWEFVKQDLGGIWEAVRPVKKGSPEEVPLWTKVSLPH
ncbi:MAG TPA: hypothetical protein VGB71_03140, partial [Flavisolibacter sp.]